MRVLRNERSLLCRSGSHGLYPAPKSDSTIRRNARKKSTSALCWYPPHLRLGKARRTSLSFWNLYKWSCHHRSHQLNRRFALRLCPHNALETRAFAARIQGPGASIADKQTWVWNLQERCKPSLLWQSARRVASSGAFFGSRAHPKTFALLASSVWSRFRPWSSASLSAQLFCWKAFRWIFWATWIAPLLPFRSPLLQVTSQEPCQKSCPSVLRCFSHQTGRLAFPVESRTKAQPVSLLLSLFLMVPLMTL